MGLFDKKYCDVCGEKIGLLGNRKLDDGNLCKNCAAKLSPFFSERRHSSVEEIKQQLAYREQNRQAVADFRCSKVLGNRTKVYLDEQNRKFMVTRATDLHAANPDVIDLSQVTGCFCDVQEHKSELYRTGSDGKRVSYNPPRYEFSYEFEMVIQVSSPWFSEIRFELTEDRPGSRLSMAYKQYEKQAKDLQDALLAPPPQAAPAAPAVPAPAAHWNCPVCGTLDNSSNFCEGCGSPRP